MSYCKTCESCGENGCCSWLKCFYHLSKNNQNCDYSTTYYTEAVFSKKMADYSFELFGKLKKDEISKEDAIKMFDNYYDLTYDKVLDNTKEYKFIKEDNNWYVTLFETDTNLTKEMCQMVCGADTFLDILSQGNNFVELYISLSPYKLSDNFQTLNLVNICEDPETGANYILKKYNGIEYNLNIWLCDVTKYIFGYYPENIYFEMVNID